jgi:hypothetical protein
LNDKDIVFGRSKGNDLGDIEKVVLAAQFRKRYPSMGANLSRRSGEGTVVTAMQLVIIAMIGVGAAVVTGLFFPVALRASQALWDLVNRA